MTITEMRNKRKKLIETMDGFLDTHKTKNGTLSAEDDKTYKTMEDEITELTNEIHRMERREEIEAELEKPVSKPIIEKPIYISRSRTIKKQLLDGKEKEEDVIVEVCIQYNESFSETMYSFVNNINTIEGGTHVSGFRKALTRTLNDYATKNELMKKMKEPLSGDDMKEGLVCVLSLKISDPQFESQTKIKLGNTEITGLVEQIVNLKLAGQKQLEK